MFPSLEVRWFAAGPPPPAVRAWWQRLPGPEQVAPARIDYYLALPDYDALGVKWRDGRMEIKQRAAERGIAQLAPQVAGAVELWRKWSLPLAAATPDPSINGPTATAWTAVHKTRRQRQYAAPPGGGLTPLPPAPLLAPCCLVELTAIEHAGRAWWTVALEALGAEADMDDMLAQAAREIFAGAAPAELEAICSCGYPRWLLMPERA